MDKIKMNASLNDLPSDLVAYIICEYTMTQKGYNAQVAALRICLLVSKQWRDLILHQSH